MIIIKLGGSVITDKAKYRKFRTETVRKLIAELPGSDLIIVHGAGSFGHIISKRYALHNGLNAQNTLEFVRVQNDMIELNLNIMKLLFESDIPAISLPVHSFHVYNGEFNFDIFERFLKLGFVPVTYGDIILNSEKKVAICSGDYLVEKLAEHFKPEHVIFVTDVDGIYTKNPKLYKDAKFIKELSLEDSIDTEMVVDDVTGGILGKLETIKRIMGNAGSVTIVNGLVPGRVKNTILKNETLCTRIKR
ncbi:MAG: isopentenyl phosphate kinase [Thermoplasmata archaeon]